jgi:hypothetical protein
MLKLADQPHQSKLELEPREGEPSLPVRMLALVETTSFDSALYIMDVKAAAFPSGPLRGTMKLETRGLLLGIELSRGLDQSNQLLGKPDL